MPLSVIERRALIEHALSIDGYERREAAERERLFDVNRTRMEFLRQLGLSDGGPTEHPNVRRCHGNTSDEYNEMWADHRRIEAGVIAFALKHRPPLVPWDTPAKLAATIDGDEELRSDQIHYMRSYGDPTITDAERRERIAIERHESCRKAYERLLKFATLAPSVLVDFSARLMADPAFGLLDIKAWCIEATRDIEPQSLTDLQKESLQALLEMSVTTDEASRRHTGEIV